MKKVQAIKCFCLIMTLFSTSVYAEFEVLGSEVSNSKTKPGTTVVNTEPVESGEIRYTGTEINCSDTDNYAPFKLVRMLMQRPDDFKVEVVGKTENDSRDKAKLQVKVTVPPYSNSCLNLKFVPVKAAGQNLHLRMKMEPPNDTYAKYKKCLEDEKVLVDGKFHAERSTESNSQHMLFDFDIDPKTSVGVVFDSPTPKRSNGNHSFVFDKSANVVSCFKSENFTEEGFIAYKSPEYDAAERAYTACVSKDHKKILSELERLRSAGNVSELIKNGGDLEKVLSAALASARNSREEKIYEEMTALADQLAEYQNEDFPHEDEREVKKITKEYANLVKELDDISIHPSISRVEVLLEKRNEPGISDDELDAIDDEIEVLNEVIGNFSKLKGGKDGKGNSELALVNRALEAYALTGQASTIEGFRLKSKMYSKVNASRRGKSLEKAESDVLKHINHFDKVVAGDWEDAYLAKRGYKSPIQRTEREYKLAMNKLKRGEAQFQRNEAKMYKKYCQPKFVMGNQQYHQRRCQKYQESRAKRLEKYLTIRERQLGYIASREGKYNQVKDYYLEYEERRMANSMEDGDDMYGFYNYSPDGDIGMDYGFSMGGSSMYNPQLDGRMPAGGQQQSQYMSPMGPMGPGGLYQGQQQTPPYMRHGGQRPPFMPQQNYFNDPYRLY